MWRASTISSTGRSATGASACGASSSDALRPRALHLDVLHVVAHQFADARGAVDVRDDLQQELGPARRLVCSSMSAPCACSPSCRWRRAPCRSRACRGGGRCSRAAWATRASSGSPTTRGRRRSAGDRRDTSRAYSRPAGRCIRRNHLTAFGVVTEAGRIGHADEFVMHERLGDLQRLGDDFAETVGSVRYVMIRNSRSTKR